ncbi:MAG: site-specific DNA-methyltransferase, partial [Anaerolineae bacterium]
MTNPNLTKFQNLLRTLFQFDCADLDFGIYRILNYKRGQVEAFITQRLPQIVDQAFAQYAAANRTELDLELEQKRQEIVEVLGEQAIDESGQLRNYHKTRLGQQYLLLWERRAQYQVADELKARVYNDLYTFFSRYYEDGDFISKRRYGRNETYAIPYNGEEVFFYWANRDQYYVKSGDRFQAYRFQAGDYRVSFALRNAAPQENGNAGNKRYFVLAQEAPLAWDEKAKTLAVAFEFRPLSQAEEQEHGRTEQQRPQDSLNQAAERAILEGIADPRLKAALARLESRNGQEKTVLLWRLHHFTRKNTPDFFIHKDLRSFLLRELDFFLKNEVLLLDELIAGDEADLQRHVLRARVVRQVAEAIIEFLAQVEDFQKKLWEKRKFVL